MKKILLLVWLLSIGFVVLAQNAEELNKQIIELYNKGEYAKAIPIAEKFVEIVKQQVGENHLEYASSLNSLAALYYQMGQYARAEPLVVKALEIIKQNLGENHLEYASSLNNLALLYSYMGQFTKAEPLSIKALEIVKQQLGENHLEYASSLNNLALLYSYMGQYTKAESLYIKAIELYKQQRIENNPYTTALNNLALLYTAMGQYTKAQPLHLKAIEINKQQLGENHPLYATNLNNLALLYHNTGLYNKAEPLLIKAIEIKKQRLGEEHPEYAVSLNNLALLYYKMRQYAKSEPLYIKAMEIRKQQLGENHPSYVINLSYLATLYGSMGHYTKAEPLFLKAMETTKQQLGETHPDYALSLNNLGLLYEIMGKFAQAEPLYVKAIEITKLQLGENHPGYAASLINLGLLYDNMGKFTKAEPLLLSSIQITLTNLFSTFAILSENEKASYLQQETFKFDVMNSFLYNYPNASSKLRINNFNLQLALKSLTLNDTRMMLQAVQNSNDTSVQKFFAEWMANKKLLARQFSLPLQNRLTYLDSIEAATESLEKELNRTSSEFRNQQTALRITMQQVQKGLKEDEAVIEFVRFPLYNKRQTDTVLYAAYVLRKNDTVPHFVPLCFEKQLEQLFQGSSTNTESLVAQLYRRGATVISQDTANVKGDSLYKLVWQPLEPLLKGIKKIAYAPAGKLYSIAFGALPVGEGKLLIDCYELQQYTSTRQVALRSTSPQNTKPQSIALFGNALFNMDSMQLVRNYHNQLNGQSPAITISTTLFTPQRRGNYSALWHELPGTAKEVQNIQQLFVGNKINTRTFVGANSSEENLKSLSGHSPKVLHIATHGFFLPQAEKKQRLQTVGFEESNTYTLAEDPLLRSGLVLAGANYAWSGKQPIEGVEDGICTAYEISQLNLQGTELAVLSACETALGDVRGSEGVYGLQRGFKMAGVDKLLVSLWRVPDQETSELMSAFYSYWLSGKNIKEAFAEAQAEMRKKYPSPFYWAAFLLVE